MSTREEMKIEKLEYKIKKLEAIIYEVFEIAIEAPDIDIENMNVTEIMDINLSIYNIRKITKGNSNE